MNIVKRHPKTILVNPYTTTSFVTWTMTRVYLFQNASIFLLLSRILIIFSQW